MIKKIRYHPFFIKLFNWEYWPFDLVYLPIYIYWMWISLKARSFFFFSPSNPTIRYSGFLMESKKEIYDLMPEETYPKTIFFPAGSSLDEIRIALQLKGISFPLIGKPDIGLKGHSVKKLNDENELAEYASKSSVDFLIQEFVSFKNEIGVFYYRYPNQNKGHISGIVKKEFLTVTGNGMETIKDLLRKNPRFILQIPILEKTYGNKLLRIPEENEECLLVPYGNHIRGAKFIDVSYLMDEKLEQMIDQLLQRVESFYYGRMDIRYNEWEELKEGRNFSIIELNGAGSEPTHIYDPKHSIFFAWKEIIRHLNILWCISKLNHQIRRLPFMSTSEGLKMFKRNKEYMRLLKSNSIQ